jgi:hypothetical protein
MTLDNTSKSGYFSLCTVHESNWWPHLRITGLGSHFNFTHEKLTKCLGRVTVFL